MTFVINHELQIKAPADVVWEVITDFPRYGEWNPFILKCESTLKPGDPIDLTVKLMAKPQFQREWIVEHEAGQRFAYRMKPIPAGALSSRRSHEVQPLAAASTRYRSCFELKGWLVPVVRGLLGGRLETGFAGMTDGIRQRAEQLWSQRQRKSA